MGSRLGFGVVFLARSEEGINARMAPLIESAYTFRMWYRSLSTATDGLTYNDAMGFDRGVLPPDRDREETFPWMGVVAAILIIGSIVAFVYFFLINAGEENVESLLTVLSV